jgi:hypothetical protein
MRLLRKLLEASLPGFVEIGKSLLSSLALHIFDPRAVREQLGHLLGLPVVIGKDALVATALLAKITAAISTVTCKPLLVTNVPEETQDTFPPLEKEGLGPRGVGSELEVPT